MRTSWPIDRHDWAGLGVPGGGIAGSGLTLLAGGEWMANLARLAVDARLRGVDVVHATDRPRDALSAVLIGRWAGIASVVQMHSNPGSHLSRSTKWGLNNATRLARPAQLPFYLVVGTGARSEIDALRQLAADCGVAEQLVFAGFHHGVRPYLDASDVFVHPSHEEPFGLAIVEAMAMAMPVVTCSSGGCRRL